MFDVVSTIHMWTEECHIPFAWTCDRDECVLVDVGRSMRGSKVVGGECITSNRSDGSWALSRACGLGGWLAEAALIVSD